MTRSPLGVQVIARAAELLRALEGCEQGLSLGQLAKQLDLPKSTVQRIVAALDHEKFVTSSTPGAGVRLGPALVRIARSARFGLVELARRSLEELAQRTGETVDLAIMDGPRAVFVDHIEGSNRLRTISAVGVTFPLHCSANGKAMMCLLEASALLKVRQVVELTRYTPNSICTWKKLDAELKKVLKAGVAFDLEEHTLGISAVAAAFTGPDGEIAAVSLPTPSVRFVNNKQKLVAALLDCRKALIEKFGHA